GVTIGGPPSLACAPGRVGPVRRHRGGVPGGRPPAPAGARGRGSGVAAASHVLLVRGPPPVGGRGLAHPRSGRAVPVLGAHGAAPAVHPGRPAAPAGRDAALAAPPDASSPAGPPGLPVLHPPPGRADPV